MPAWEPLVLPLLLARSTVSFSGFDLGLGITRPVFYLFCLENNIAYVQRNAFGVVVNFLSNISPVSYNI